MRGVTEKPFGMFGRKRVFNKQKLLAAASKAQAKGKHKKAVSFYEELLRVEPNDTDLHRKAAPALARAKRCDEAWKSFRMAGLSLVEAGFVDKAVGVYREAVHYMPRHVEAWLAIGDLEVDRGRQRDASQVLLEGRRHFRARKQRPEAIQLLGKARQLDPSNFEAGMDLARLWRKTGNRDSAQRLLRELRLLGGGRRRLVQVRAAELRLAPTPAAALRWLRALLLAR